MNIFESINNVIINWIFSNKDFYSNYIASENLQTKLISFIIDFTSFIIPFGLFVLVFAIPVYFLIKAFTKVIKQLNTNVITAEGESRREKRKKK